ncbi:MAG: hypothetical protein FWE04_02885, partial [Oscillospiraceae bacterium]|nr:hypothetical protein [Oscillospiraceae bacterium]
MLRKGRILSLILAIVMIAGIMPGLSFSVAANMHREIPMPSFTPLQDLMAEREAEIIEEYITELTEELEYISESYDEIYYEEEEFEELMEALMIEPFNAVDGMDIIPISIASPFNVASGNNTQVSLVSGALTYTHNLFSVNNGTGLPFGLNIQYNSSDAAIEPMSSPVQVMTGWSFGLSSISRLWQTTTMSYRKQLRLANGSSFEFEVYYNTPTTEPDGRIIRLRNYKLQDMELRFIRPDVTSVEQHPGIYVLSHNNGQLIETFCARFGKLLSVEDNMGNRIDYTYRSALSKFGNAHANSRYHPAFQFLTRISDNAGNAIKIEYIHSGAGFNLRMNEIRIRLEGAPNNQVITLNLEYRRFREWGEFPNPQLRNLHGYAPLLTGITDALGHTTSFTYHNLDNKMFRPVEGSNHRQQTNNFLLSRIDYQTGGYTEIDYEYDLRTRRFFREQINTLNAMARWAYRVSEVRDSSGFSVKYEYENDFSGFVDGFEPDTTFNDNNPLISGNTLGFINNADGGYGYVYRIGRFHNPDPDLWWDPVYDDTRFTDFTYSTTRIQNGVRTRTTFNYRHNKINTMTTFDVNDANHVLRNLTLITRYDYNEVNQLILARNWRFNTRFADKTSAQYIISNTDNIVPRSQESWVYFPVRSMVKFRGQVARNGRPRDRTAYRGRNILLSHTDVLGNETKYYYGYIPKIFPEPLYSRNYRISGSPGTAYYTPNDIFELDENPFFIPLRTIQFAQFLGTPLQSRAIISNAQQFEQIFNRPEAANVITTQNTLFAVPGNARLNNARIMSISTRYRSDDAVRTVTRAFTYFAAQPGNVMTETLSSSCLGDIRTTTFAYDPAGVRVASMITNATNTSASADFTLEDEQEIEVSFLYNHFGQVIRETDALGRHTHHTYNAVGWRTSTTNPDSSNVLIEYSIKGANGGENVIATIYNGSYVTFAYFDGLGRPLKRTELDQSWNSENERILNRYVHRPGSHNIERVYDANGNFSVFQHDSLNRVTSVGHFQHNLPNNALGHQSIVYNDFERTVTVSNAGHTNTTTHFDEVGRAVQSDVRISAGRYATTLTEFDHMSNVRRTRSPMEKWTNFHYDPVGRLIEVIDPMENRFEYTYDALGNILEVVSNDLTIQTNEFDNLGRLLRRSDALGMSEYFAYDELGRLVASRDRKEQETTFVYEPLSNR